MISDDDILDDSDIDDISDDELDFLGRSNFNPRNRILELLSLVPDDGFLQNRR